MKHIAHALLVASLTSLFACGGGSSPIAEEEEEIIIAPPPPPAFSFKVLQRNECGEVAPISGVEFLVYDESPNDNLNSTFSKHYSDSEGLIELGVESSSLVSFTLNATDANNDLISYSFTELVAGNYNMLVLFGEEANNNDTCICQDLSIEAQISGEHYFEEIRTAQLFGGNAFVGGSYSTSGPTINYSSELCRDDFDDQPLIATAIMHNYDDQVIFGVTDSPQIATVESELFVLDQVSLKQPKPDLGESYSLDHALIINNQSNLVEWGLSDDNSYTPFEGVAADAHYFNLQSSMAATYNGQETFPDDAFAYGEKTHRTLQQSSNASLAGGLPSATRLDISYDEPTRTYTWTSDSADNTSIILTGQRYNLTNGQRHLWYVYSPNTTSVVVPKNTSEIEAEIEQSTLRFRYLNLYSADQTSSFSEYLAARRFSDSQGEKVYSVNEDSLISLYYRPSTNQNQTKEQGKAAKQHLIQQLLAQDPNL